MRKRAVAVAVVLAVGVPVGGVFMPSLGASDPDDTGSRPVITPPEPWNSYPLAEVEGALELREGCLLLGDEVVFWPHGTGWDDARRAVTFDDLAPAAIGEPFNGGGGHYPRETDFVAWLGHDAGGAIEDCLTRTGAPGAVFAYASGELQRG